MAVFLVLFCIIFKVFNLKYYYDIEPNKTVNLKAKLIKIEEKANSDYLFVDADTFGKAIIVAPKNLPIKLGQSFNAKCKNVAFNKARNFGNFDEENYYKSLGYGYKFKTTKLEVLSKKYDYLRQKLFEVRKKFTKILDETLSSSKSGTLKAIVLGDKSCIEDETKDLYQKNGIAHILAISGLHISLIGMGLFSLLNKKNSVIFSAFFSCLFMIAFCIMSGESVSAIRATIMFILRMTALIFGKSFDMLNALSVSAIILLITNPLYIFNTSFLLSFLAILAIAFLALLVQKYIEADRYKNKILIAVIASSSVFIVTLPIISNSYYEISLYSVLLNLIVIPLMSFILGSALFSAILGVISIAISRFAIGIGVFLLDAINILCVITDKIPFSVVVTGNISWLKIIIFYFSLIIFLFLIFVKSKKQNNKLNKKSKKIICLLMMVFLVLIIFIKIPDNKLRISFLDVDQGDGILIKAQNGTTFLIDGGSTSVSNVKEYRIESALKYKKISKIDIAIVTHPDLDHISGLMDLINDNSPGAIMIKSVYIPSIDGDENYEKLKLACKENNVNFNNIYSGLFFEEKGLKISCLHPDKSYKNNKSINAYSTVLELKYGDFSALFVGDLEDDGEKILLSKKFLHDVDVLKVSHHGSRNSSSIEFLSAIKPKIAVISAGVNNSYGHPHKETLKRLDDIGAKVYCTAQTGEVDLSIDKQGNVAVKTKL